MFYTKLTKLKIVSPTPVAILEIESYSLESRAINISGDLHSKSGDWEIFIILSKIGRSPAKSGDLEALGNVYCLCGQIN